MPGKRGGRGVSRGRCLSRGGRAGGRGRGVERIEVQAENITGFGAQRASANVQVETLDLLPRGQPYETHKEGIRKRKWTPRTKASTSSTPRALGTTVDTSNEPSTSCEVWSSWSTLGAQEPLTVPSPGLFEECTTLTPPPLSGIEDQLSLLTMSSLPSLSSTPAPSPLSTMSPPPLPLTSVMQPYRVPHKRNALSDQQISDFLNYGSDDEDEDEEDDADDQPTYPVSSRVDRDFEVEVEIEREVYDVPAATPITEENVSAATVQQFHFDWRRMSQNENSRSRRCTFVGDNKGKANFHYDTPYDAFTAIWDVEFLQKIAFQTNLYAQQYAEHLIQQQELTVNSRIQFWKDTDVDELYTFFAIYLAMGVVVKSSIPSYWCRNGDIFSTPGFSAAMSLRRFQLLNTCLHFVNNNEMAANNLDTNRVKLYKIQPVVDHLNNLFPGLYTLGRNLALDESLTMWKGWLSINQKIRTKAAKKSIKTYEVCESDTGFLWRFEVHTGPAQERHESPISGPIPSLVLRLLRGLENKGFTIWMDNYYNSPALSRVLKSLDFDCVGTLLRNCQFVPIEIANLGQTSLAVNEVIACTSTDVDVVAWRDKRLVCLTSTYHGNAVSEEKGKLLPTIVSDYNVCMGGVDRKDQLLAMYPIERKRMRCWYKKFFRRLLNVSVLNAYIIFNRSPVLPSRTTHRQFRLDLIKELLSRHCKESSRQSLLNSNQPSARKLPPEITAHFPQELPMREDGKFRLRRRCVRCGNRTSAICLPCKAPLCVFKCFIPYHSIDA